MKVLAYGGGVQSSAMVVLAVQGRIPDVDAALFSNVGDDSEHPATLRYVRDVMRPWAAEYGLPVHELQRIPTRGVSAGNVETLLRRLTREGSRSVPIPVRMSNGAPGIRSCTADFKIRVIAKWLKEHGASADNPATVCIGISTDEMERAANRKQRAPHERVVYPLLNLGLSRDGCAQVIRAAGLPVPPKSSCWFCPFHRPAVWAEMRRDEPDLFWQAVGLERTLNDRQDRLGKDHVFLTRFARPLDEAINEAQPSLFDVHGGIGESGCDEGVCFV